MVSVGVDVCRLVLPELIDVYVFHPYFFPDIPQEGPLNTILVKKLSLRSPSFQWQLNCGMA